MHSKWMFNEFHVNIFRYASSPTNSMVLRFKDKLKTGGGILWMNSLVLSVEMKASGLLSHDLPRTLFGLSV